VRVPDEAGPGRARVTFSFDRWQEGRVAPTTVEIPVVSPTNDQRNTSTDRPDPGGKPRPH
jgi:hypothetical protein